VANTHDIIMSDTPNHPAGTLRAAPEEIRRDSRREFEAEIVKFSLSMPDKIWDDLRNEIQTSLRR
jgi:hypothetical protein